MPVYREGALTFQFADDARVVRWEKDPAYTSGIARLQRTKTVDFFVQHTLGPALVEVSDLRGHQTANKRKISSGEMATEVAEKVRDSVAGMIWACERSLSTAKDLERLVYRLVNREEKVDVVFWLEDDLLQPAAADVLAREIERRLRSWLNTHVTVTSATLERLTRRPLDWVSVSHAS